MAVSDALRPGSRLGTYPQRFEQSEDALERVGQRWLDRLGESLSRRRYRTAFVADRVDRAGKGLDALDEQGLGECVRQVRESLLRDGLTDIGVVQSLALLRELAARRLAMRPYDVQLFGAWVIVRGGLAEMATGEGKSLTAALAAASAALAGIPVHVVTTNEYLAERDAGEMRPLYEALGLTVTALRDDMDFDSRYNAYRCDVVYVTNKQIAFDYLRDRLASRNARGPLSMRFSQANMERQLLLRGLCFAIVDEADSVLVDEARTPLLLSREHSDPDQERIYREALELARALEAEQHFRVDERQQSVVLTPDGIDWLGEQLEGRTGVWSGARHARHLVHQALCALHLYVRDRHYLVRNDAVEIIDHNTGRTMPDRSWQRGLHQMIECKEDCPVSGQRETLSSISYQRFFRRYLHLGGMSGTLRQVRHEMRKVYRLRVVPVPTHLPCRRSEYGFTLHRRASEKWLAVLADIERVHATGQPVLIGTGSVRDSELLNSLLTRRGLPHRVLNARQDRHEAGIIARAGQRRQITVATSMAGRGTDIRLGDGVAELGGLHVIVTDCHEEYRVDRQLHGRSARQGDPGSVATHVSLNDPLLQRFYSARLRRMIGWYMRDEAALGDRSSRLLIGIAQFFRSAHYRAERREVMRSDEMMSRMLAYTGQQE